MWTSALHAHTHVRAQVCVPICTHARYHSNKYIQHTYSDSLVELCFFVTYLFHTQSIAVCRLAFLSPSQPRFGLTSPVPTGLSSSLSRGGNSPKVTQSGCCSSWTVITQGSFDSRAGALSGWGEFHVVTQFPG